MGVTEDAANYRHVSVIPVLGKVFEDWQKNLPFDPHRDTVLFSEPKRLPPSPLLHAQPSASGRAYHTFDLVHLGFA